jgi:uncharacterized RDD family membrane protein YckC
MMDPEDLHRSDAWALEAKLSEGTISRRIFAFVIDGILVSGISTFLYGILFLFGVFTLGLGFPLLRVVPFVAPAYNWLSLMSPLGATPGQALLGLTVRDADDLSPPGPVAALVWTIGFYASLALWGVPFVLAFFSPRRRTAHDMVSGLVVIRARALTGWLGTWNVSAGGPPPA